MAFFARFGTDICGLRKLDLDRMFGLSEMLQVVVIFDFL